MIEDCSKVSRGELLLSLDPNQRAFFRVDQRLTDKKQLDTGDHVKKLWLKDKSGTVYDGDACVKLEPNDVVWVNVRGSWKEGTLKQVSHRNLKALVKCESEELAANSSQVWVRWNNPEHRLLPTQDETLELIATLMIFADKSALKELRETFDREQLRDAVGLIESPEVKNRIRKWVVELNKSGVRNAK